MPLKTDDGAAAKSGTNPPVLDLPTTKGPHKFVLQEHQRGKSSHMDLRFQVNDHLIGFTLDDPGRVGDPLMLSNNPEESTKKKILSQMKSRQPIAWLKVKGSIAPGGIGATKNQPARFIAKDSGLYEMGAQKSNFLEVFLKGKTYSGRFVFRKLPRPSDSENAEKQPFVWFFWKPIKQSPYVISRRGINDQFIPPKGKSAMPKDWEAKIPAALRWWEKNWTGEQALSTIQEIRKILLKRNILTSEMLNFTLQRRWWKGQKVIRDMPIQHWVLNLSTGTMFDLDGNPLEQKKGINAVKKTAVLENINFVGQIEAGKPGNPNKRIPMNVELLDKGKVNRIESTEQFSSMKFSGNKLKGFWILKKKDSGWTFEQSQEAPKPKKIENTELRPGQLGLIKHLTRNQVCSLSEIANTVGCSKSTVMYHQKKMGLR